MVAGADKLLDIIAKENDHVYITISDKPFEDSNFTLVFDKPEAGGAMYNLVSEIHKFKLWLCHVTKFVFKGKLPDIIYCNA